MKDYATQFKVATLEVYHLDESVAMVALKRGLQPSCLTYSLDKAPTKNYLEMLTRAQKCIHGNEGALSQCEADGKLSKKKAREEPSGAPSSKPNSSHRWSPRPRNSTGRSDNYTPVLIFQSKILMEIEGE